MWAIYICAFFIFCTLVDANIPPKLDDFVPKRSQSLGTKFGLFCSLFEGSKPIQFEWLRNGRQLLPSDSRYRIETTIDNSVLTIPSLIISDTLSNFTCSVRNNVGSDSKYTILTVKGLIIQLVFPSICGASVAIYFQILDFYFVVTI